MGKIDNELIATILEGKIISIAKVEKNSFSIHVRNVGDAGMEGCIYSLAIKRSGKGLSYKMEQKQ